MRLEVTANTCIGISGTIRQAMQQIGPTQLGVVFIVDGERKLLGTATDGDIRRALLKGADLDSSIDRAMNQSPIVAPDTLSEPALATLMRANSIRQLPLVDVAGRVVAIEYLDATPVSYDGPITAVIMAGGEGQRLRPLTDSTPKPMLPVAGRPILEILVDSLKMSGFKRILISVGYLGDMIRKHFGDGSDLGVDIHYLTEHEPLGTAGALGLIPPDLRPTTPVVVVNGDLLTSLRLAAFRDFHIAADYDLTLCCRPYEVSVPFGYPIVEGDLVTGFREKPKFHYLVNSGIYCLSPSILEGVPAGKPYNMTDLIEQHCRANSETRVGVFPLREPFHEIGRMETYKEGEAFYWAHVAPALGIPPKEGGPK
ncbi:MAG TPA: alcohol dehydrogenase [Candidatus Latescibacteria bacterium]|nr:alcohol dehydrogenase [Candidatus Latescibacterota bacterium]